MMVSCSIGVLLAAFAPSLTAQTDVVQRKLSGPMVVGAIGDVADVKYSPSGDRVLYGVMAGSTVSTAHVDHLEVAPSDGSAAPTLLFPPGNWTVDASRWTLDGTRVVFVRTELRRTLYSIPADGSAPPTTLFSPAGGESLTELPSWAEGLQLTSDGTRVLYQRVASGIIIQLYSVPVAGGASVRLNGDLVTGGTVRAFLASPVGSTVVYLANQTTRARDELFAVPADGSAPAVKISHVLGPPDDVEPGFAIDPTGSRVVYRVRVDLGTTHLVFSAPLDGSSAAVQLCPTLQSGREVTSFRVSPDGASVLYRADKRADGQYELFLAPIDGSAPAAPLVPVFAGGAVDDDYQFSPAGAHVVLQGNTGGGSPVQKLFSVRVSDGAIHPLHTARAASFRITPSSARVVFAGLPELGRLRRLFSTPIDGSGPSVQINPEFVANGALDARTGDPGYGVSPNSQHVIYRADADTVGRDELYRVATVPSGAPVATKLNPPLVLGGQVDLFYIGPSSSFLAYRADAENDEVFELFRAPGHVPLSGALPMEAVGDARDFVVRNGRVVYAADQERNERVELFGVPSDGSSPPVKLSGSLVQGGDVVAVLGANEFVLTADGSTVVYTADADVDERFEIFSAPADGSAPRVKLNGPPRPTTDIEEFRVSADGARVVFLGNVMSHSGFHLHSVPIHGGSSVALASVPADTRFEITPDSTHVLYENLRLYSVPLDGSSAPVALSGSAVAVSQFAATPDGSRAVFIRGSGLFGNSVLGGELVDLSGPLVQYGHVAEFAIDPAGERVVYLADSTTYQRVLLLSVPVDGSPGRIVLNGLLVGGGDVLRFRIAPDGKDVVYMADQVENNSERLHRVPLDGSAPDVQLSEEDLENAPFTLTPDGAHALIYADDLLFLDDGLFSLPVAGGDLVQVSPAPNVFAFAAGGRRVAHFEGGGLRLTPIGGGASLALQPDANGIVQRLAVDGRHFVHQAYASYPFDGPVEVYASWLVREPAEHAPPAHMRSVSR